MKNIYLYKFLAIWLSFVLSISFCQSLSAQDLKPISKPAALIELFTSQGCSSCPPAHKVIEEVKADYMSSDGVLFINFHVDYWDNLGWKDPFSNNSSTKRQQMYQKSFGEEGLYTPQFVVMGQSGFSGNNELRLRREIKAILTSPNSTQLYNLSKLYKEQEKLIFNYETTDFLNSSIFNAALISLNDTTFIEEGENKGRNLSSHNNVVKFLSIPFRQEGGKAFINTADLTANKSYSLVTWIQDIKSNVIYDVHVYSIDK